MSNLATVQNQPVNMGAIENVLMRGDLSGLNEVQRLQYYKQVCETVGLNTLTKPFEYIQLNGKLVLYATKGCGEQLRSRHKISIKIVCREKIEDVYVVTAEAHNPDGRVDSSTGAVSIGNAKGENLANAMMKAETKAKRRVTLSICGLNMLDEIEVESIPGAQMGAAVQPTIEQPKIPPTIEPPKVKVRTKGLVGSEIEAAGEKLGLFQEQIRDWAREIYKKESREMTLVEMEEFLVTLQTELGRKGII
jgi:hypothetical protein